MENKNLIQSYHLTASRYDYSVYEKRIMYRIIETLQKFVNGKKLEGSYTVQPTLFNDLDMAMPIKEALMENDYNYNRIKNALISLNQKVLERKTKSGWGVRNIIERPDIERTQGMMYFRISPEIANVFLDFSKGYSKFELKVAFNMESIYAMRFYEIISNNSAPVVYTIQELREIFKLEDKYERVSDFFKYVLDTAKRELDSSAPWTFRYEKIKHGRTIHAIKLIPILQASKQDQELIKKELQQRASLRWELAPSTADYLKQKFGFLDSQIKNNIQDFANWHGVEPDPIAFISRVFEDVQRKGDIMNPKGYFINTIRMRYKELMSKMSF